MRTHVEVDPGVGLRGFEGVRALIDDYRWAIDLEICVFPQEGLTNNPGTEELMVAGAEARRAGDRRGTGYDTDQPAQIRRIFELAREFDVDIDIHLDFGSTPIWTSTSSATLPSNTGSAAGSRSAMTKLALVPPAELATDRATACRCRRGGDGAAGDRPVPDGARPDHAVRRGVADANFLIEHGVNCSISSNNILNPFTPFGDCSLLRIANLQANVPRSAARADRACFDMLTTRSARLLRLEDYGIAVGNPADIVVLDAEQPGTGGRRDPRAARGVQAWPPHRHPPPGRTPPPSLTSSFVNWDGRRPGPESRPMMQH